MRVILIQHGQSVPKAEDPARPLSPAGREEVSRTADRLGRIGTDARAIWHSRKRRAEETAQLVAAALDDPAPRPLEAREELAPLADPGWLVAEARAAERDLVVCGHLPHLARVASRLLADRDEPAVVGFCQGGLVVLERQPEGAFALRCAVPPDLA